MSFHPEPVRFITELLDYIECGGILIDVDRVAVARLENLLPFFCESHNVEFAEFFYSF